MSNDDLLRALGRLSARQAEDDERPLPPELTAPAPAATRQHLAAQALAALAPEPMPEAERAPGLRTWVQRLYARRTLLLVTPALGAAAMGLMFARGRGGPPLPAYTMQLSGGVASVRGEAPVGQQPLQLTEGSRVELHLRPERPIAAGGLDVQLYWARGGQQVRWSATTELSAQGAVRVVGPASRPFGPGEGELVVVVGRPGGVAQTLRAPVRWR
jgi:hypothetical protein